ncbi:unnamed protein product, partial [Prorocentrum cordatum]
KQTCETPNIDKPHSVAILAQGRSSSRTHADSASLLWERGASSPSIAWDGMPGSQACASPCGRGSMAKLGARCCRLYQRGCCLRGRECPMLHAVHLTTGAAPAHPGKPDNSESDSSREDNWTSSSCSRSWADMSEGLCAVQPAEPPRAWSTGAASSCDELPSFDERIAYIPEFMPSESLRPTTATSPRRQFGGSSGR